MNLEDIQDRILEQLHEGEPIDRDALFSAHEEHADALRQFFGVLDIMEAEATGQEDAPTRLGEFRIVREIGRGGMGIVFEAEQTSLKRRVALKVLPTALRSDRRLLSRFRREAEAAARLRHPNIVPVYSIGQAGNAPFFAMEMVSGQSLAEVLDERRADRDGGLPQDAGEYQRRCVEIVGQLADALAYAHGQGILHRDVKPANVLLEADGTPRLTDFGLAADLEASSLTVSGEVFGSPRYMSPEQAFRCEKPLDARTDVYSLGVTLYEMLTLRLPYQGTTTSELLAALSVGQVVSPREFGIELPAGLERVLMRALCRDLDERYAGIAEFADDLRAAMQGRLARPRRRPLRWLKLTAMALLATIATFALIDAIQGRSVLERMAEHGRPLTGDAEMPVRWEQIEALADGKPQPEEVMDLLFEPSVEVRPVMVRSASFLCRAGFRIRGIGSSQQVHAEAAGKIAVVCLLEFSIDGGEWQHPVPGGVVLSGYQFLGDGAVTQFVGYEVQDYLAGLQERGSLRLSHRATVRIFRLTDGQSIVHGKPITYAPDRFPFNVESGTCRQWTLPVETVFCYDDYPADYPERVSDPVLRDEMERAFAPAHVVFGDFGVSGVSGRSLMVGLVYPERLPRPVPLAGELDLLAVGSDEVVASYPTFRMEPPLGRDRYLGSGLRLQMVFGLSAEQTDAQQRLLLELAAGELSEVRLVLRPSREVALLEPPLTRYWVEPVEVTVPVVEKGR